MGEIRERGGGNPHSVLTEKSSYASPSEKCEAAERSLKYFLFFFSLNASCPAGVIPTRLLIKETST